MPFPRATPMSEVTFQRGRGAARGAVHESRSFDTVSTTVHRSFNREARGRSRVKVLVASPAAPIGYRCRLSSSWKTRARSQLWRYANATLTVARGRTFRVRLSRWRWQRCTCTRVSVRPDHFGARARPRRRKIVPVGPRNYSCRVR